MRPKLAQPKHRMLRPHRDLPHNLLGWYDRARRDMPWRGETDPYRIWLSETMLQQTQVETVKPYYRKFLQQFPTVQKLAQAHLQDVLAAWAGLGYYRRAKHLHLAAQKVVSDFNSTFPSSPEALRTLPGIGRYTAGAVASIAFNAPTPVVDGNVIRVLARLTGYSQDVSTPKNVEPLWTLAQSFHDDHLQSTPSPRRHGDLNQALMELGATVCLPPPGRPQCLLCPLSAHCVAAATSRQLDFPVKTNKTKIREVRATAVVLVRTHKPTASSPQGIEVLLAQRAQSITWEGMWEFPVVTDAPALLRSLGLAAPFPDADFSIRHQLSHRTYLLDILRADIPAKSKTSPQQTPQEIPGVDGPYVAARWVPWPMKTAILPMSRLVQKIAETAGLPL